MSSFGFILTYLLHDVGQINHILVLRLSIFYFSESSVVYSVKRFSSSDGFDGRSTNKLSRFELP